MNLNYVIITFGLITCCISLFFLKKYSENIESVMSKKSTNHNPNHTHAILNKLNELEKNINNNLKENKIDRNDERVNFVDKSNVNKSNEHIYLSEVEKLDALGYSKEEIAKKTNKSIREVDLILKLKKR